MKKTGFTTLELLVVISLIGILTAVTIPAFNTFNQGQTLKNAAVELKNNLRFAQNKSLSGMNTCMVSYGSPFGGYKIIFTADSSNYQLKEICGDPAQEVSLSTYNLPSLDNIRIKTNGWVVFKPVNLGIELSSSPLKVSLEGSSGTKYCVTITSTGDISEKQGNCS